MNSFISYLKNVRAELSHVVWPKPRQAVVHTALIIVISVVIGVFVGLVDAGFTHVVAGIVNR